MTQFSVVIQQAIYDKLSADLSYPVYDDVPQPKDSGKKSDFPYITIGEDNLIYADTDESNRVEASIVIHTWSRYQGRLETKQIQGEIYDSLHRALLSAVGYNFVTITMQNATSAMDADGITRHGVQTFKLILEER